MIIDYDTWDCMCVYYVILGNNSSLILLFHLAAILSEASTTSHLPGRMWCCAPLFSHTDTLPGAAWYASGGRPFARCRS